MTATRADAGREPRTEQRNARTRALDQQSTLDLLRMLNAEDALVPSAVADALVPLAAAVDLAVRAVEAAHRVHYFGAGTSGRLAALDVAELGPTYGLAPGVFVAHAAGGPGALQQALPAAEDDAAAGATEAGATVTGGDVVLGVSACGRTPYVLGALAAARAAGAGTALVTSDPAADVPVDVLVAVDTGPEAVAGSTRMKAASAQKLVLTAFSTAVMVRTGRTYSNLMVELAGDNAKLRRRTVTVLAEATGLDGHGATAALAAAGGDLKTALVSVLARVDTATALRALRDGGGRVREALDVLR